MSLCRSICSLFIWIAVTAVAIYAQAAPQSYSAPEQHAKRPTGTIDSGIDAGSVTSGTYRNKTLTLSCKIPPGWVLRTEEMNAREGGGTAPGGGKSPTGEDGGSARAPDSRGGCPHMCSKVLLAAFSRPPEARAEEVNASILIAAESVESYPGLKDAAQYFGPLTEVAKAQGFSVDEEPYEIAVGTKTLVRGDFHKDVGTRVMHQSTLAMLAHGYAVSITLIAGTEDELEELIDRMSFAAAK